MTLYKIDNKGGVSFEAIMIIQGKDGKDTGDFFPQNQWIVTEEK